MKKIYCLIALLALALNAEAQKEVDFKIDYKPNSTYVQKMDIKMTMAIGTEEDGESFNQPLDMLMTHTVKTGTLKNNTLPFTAQMDVDSPMIGAAADQIKDWKFYGKFVNGTPQVDSISGTGANSKEANEAMNQAITKSLSQFPVMSKKIKIGESITTNKIPMNLANGMNVAEGTDIVVTYTLKKIEAKKAYFDMFMDTPLTIDMKGMKMKGTIKFTGTMIYDIDSHFVESQLMNMTSGFEMKHEEATMNLKMDGTNTVTVTVTPN